MMVATFDPLSLVGGRIDRDSPGRISYTRLTSYLRCPARYQFQYIEKFPTAPSGAMMAGQAGHEVIEAMVKEDWFSSPDAVESYGAKLFVTLLDEKIEAAGGMDLVTWSGRQLTVIDEGGNKVQMRDPSTGEKVFKLGRNGRKYPVWEKSNEDYRWWCRMGPLMMKRAGTILRDDVESGVTIEAANVERQVAAWLEGPGSAVITGVIDQMLLVEPTGERKVRDWKTGGHMSLDPLQLANYGWLLRATEREEDRIYADLCEFIYLRGGERDAWRKPFDVSQWIPLIPQLYREALYGIAAGFFPLRPSPMCTSCWVRLACPYGRTLGDE